jgi:hypothetical protein
LQRSDEDDAVHQQPPADVPSFFKRAVPNWRQVFSVAGLRALRWRQVIEVQRQINGIASPFALNMTQPSTGNAIISA